MNKKRAVRIVIAAVLLAVLAFAYWVFASFNGSLIKKAVTTAKVRDYIEETYPGQPFEVERCRYDFKMMGYFCKVQSTESEDTYFLVWETGEGMADDYEVSVLQRQNTLQRLSMALDDYTEALMSRIYPYRTSLIICDSASTLTEEDYQVLEPDMPFDVNTFPLPADLTVWVETQNDAPSWEELAERLRELEALTREELPFVERFSVSVQSTYLDEDGEYVPSDYNAEVCAFDVPREVITGNGLEDYLAEVRARQEAELAAIERGENIKSLEDGNE